MRDLEEVDTLTPDEKQVLAELKKVVLGFVPDATLLLYGSRARGTAAPESDYDVLALVDAPLTTQEEDAILDAVYELELSREVMVSLMLYTRSEWDLPLIRVSPYRREVQKEGVPI